jgi:hypothetical protein
MLKIHLKLPKSPENEDAIRSIKWAIKWKKSPGWLADHPKEFIRKKIDHLAQIYRTNPQKFKEKRVKI